MDINIKKNNIETIILKTAKKEKKKHVKIWICIYFLITIFVQYSILKTLKVYHFLHLRVHHYNYLYKYY